MNLRDFLQHREGELTQEIAALHETATRLEADLRVFREAEAVVNRPQAEFSVESGCDEPLAEYACPSAATVALRDFLQGEEEKLVSQMNDVRTALRPLEAELAEVRRAKTAIGLGASRIAPAVESLTSIITGIGRVAMVMSEAQRRSSEILRAEHEQYQLETSNESVPKIQASPYAQLTMKQLVLKALSEHFRDTGATTQQLLAFFRDGWGRDIARQNLSPQLSRLYQEGRIGRIPSARGWFLIPDEIVIGFRPYLLRGRVIWAGPEVADNEYEPLLAHLHRFRFAEAGAPTEGQRPYRLRHRAFHAGRLQRAGEIVWLLPSEASDHHEPVAEDD